jgi:hypothetical protein
MGQSSDTSAYKVQTPGNTQQKAYNIQNTAKVWNQQFVYIVTEHSAKEARFDCRNERVSYICTSNVSYLHLWQALPYTTPLFLSVALPIEMTVECPIKLHLQHTYDFIVPLLHNITETGLGRTFTEKMK